MARGFGTGVLWGLLVVGVGLTALSQLAPPPASLEPITEAPAVTLTVDAAGEAAADEQAAAERAAKVEADRAAAEAAAEAAAKADAEGAAADTASRHKSATEAPPVEEVAIIASAPPATAAASPEAIAASEALPDPDVPTAKDEVPSLAGLGQALSEPADEAAPASVEPVPAEPEGPKDALSEPGQPAGQDEPQRLPQIAPAADPDLAPEPPVVVAEPATDSLPEASPGVEVKDRPTVLPSVRRLSDKLPKTVLDKSVPGVKAGGLPQIGAEPAAEMPETLSPVQRYARSFEPEGKPLFVILLRDIGGEGMAREDLAKLPFPISFVIDPLSGDATDASAAYRAAGQEVLTLANGIPQGAEASDLETTFATLSSILPESVAIIDQDIGGFQDKRPLATLVLPVINGEGRGLVTYDRGLNAADQIARREGVPAAVIFRRLDAEGEDKATVRRHLDRAAFKATQEGSVVVIGDTRAETVAAILEWTVEGRAATVTLAPVTAVMGR
jgi:uncharacterized protein